MGWNYKSIEETARKRSETEYATFTREQLLERIVQLEIAIYPVFIALKPATEKSWRGTNVSSMLFPSRPEEDDNGFMVVDRETFKIKNVKLQENELHSAGFVTEEGLSIEDGTNLHDNFELLAFHQEAPGCYIGNGALFMSDVRRLVSVAEGGSITATNEEQENG